MNPKLAILLCSLLGAGSIPSAVAQEVRAAQAANADSYRIYRGDKLSISVHGQPDLAKEPIVTDDGSVQLPLIGKVKVEGLTTLQAEQRIAELYRDGWLKKPQPTVNVTEYSKAVITVKGEVNKGGAIAVPRNRKLTLMQAIGFAGGFTPGRANQSAVKLTRGNKTRTLNVKAMVDNPATDVVLQDGDIITVDRSVFGG